VTEYLSTDDVIDLYVIAVRATGDEPQGLRDRGPLESAVMRPQFLAHDGDLTCSSRPPRSPTGLVGRRRSLTGTSEPGSRPSRSSCASTVTASPRIAWPLLVCSWRWLHRRLMLRGPSSVSPPGSGATPHPPDRIASQPMPVGRDDEAMGLFGGALYPHCAALTRGSFCAVPSTTARRETVWT
jgi:hypothetical protein